MQICAVLSHASTTRRVRDGSTSINGTPIRRRAGRVFRLRVFGSGRQINPDQKIVRQRGTKPPISGFPDKFETAKKESVMKGIVAYFLGIPIVVIILLYVTGIF